ncbi:MAG: 50S ribosomal protein L22 [Actinomycetes bacterium]|jgi:large subunit ribosomal protein L22|nr:50S ribosomal protein L22 [Actinomycetes bacterium]
MFSKAVAKHQRIAPRKARLVVDLIRGKSVDEARAIVKFSTRAAAETVEKVLNSAVANAEHKEDHVKAETLYVSEAYVDEGPTLKRIRAGAKGMAKRINKRSCHITIVLDQIKEA